MASSGTLASLSNQIDKLQDPPPPALGSSSASLGLEPPNLRGCDTEIVSLPASDTVPSMPHDLTAVVEASSPLEISDIATDIEELSSNPSTAFVPSIGAWAKPLAFAPPATPPTPATSMDFDPQYLNNLLDTFWPTLTDGVGQNQKKRDQQTAIREFPHAPVQKIPVPELKEDGTLRFPWAARMNPAARNLYRATKPTFRLDGTPQVTIPSQVLSLGPENKREYIIGHFHRCSLPHGGLIHAVVNRLWGRSCRIGCRKISELSYMFHIPHDSTREWVVQRGVWHVDDCLLFVSPWKTSNSLKIPEVSTIPVWVTLKNVPDCCYSILGLSHVASGLGEPMQTHKPRLDLTSLGEAKLLVEVELDKPFPKQIALDDKQGNIFLVDVEYTWIPSVCGRCGHLGHKEKRCLLPAVQVKTSMQEGPSKEALGAEPDEEQSQVNAASDQEVVQIENSEVSLILPENPKGVYAEQILGSTNEIEKLQSQKSAELKVLSTPANTPTHSKVTVAIGSNSQSISSPLAGEKSAPVKSLTMEKAPSNIIVSDRQASADDHLICSPNAKTPENQHPDHDTMCYDHATGFVIGDSSTSFGLTRGGRPIKPTQKFKDMEWHTVGGRGKRGRGRGYRPPN